MLVITIGIAFILLFTTIRFWRKHKQGLPLSRLERLALVSEIVTGILWAIYILVILSQIFGWFSSPLGWQIVISPQVNWSIFIILTFISVILVIRFWRWYSIKPIERVRAYIFFPAGTPEENKNLGYHAEHFHKRLIINFKKKVPQAYPLPNASTCYGWRLIHKFPDTWVSVEDSIYPNPDTQKWCSRNGYHLNQWSASKKELLEIDSPEIKAKETVEQEQSLKEKSSFDETKTELLQALHFFLEHWGTYKKLIENKQLESPQSGEIKWCSDQIKSAIVRARILNLNEVNAVIPQIEVISNDMALFGVAVQRFPQNILILYGEGDEEKNDIISRGDTLYERVKQVISDVEQAFR